MVNYVCITVHLDVPLPFPLDGYSTVSNVLLNTSCQKMEPDRLLKYDDTVSVIVHEAVICVGLAMFIAPHVRLRKSSSYISF